MDPENLIWVSIEISFLLEKDEVVVWESFISLESRGCRGQNGIIPSIPSAGNKIPKSCETCAFLECKLWLPE